MGRSWIFLRGLGRNSVHWGPFLDHFRKAFPEDQIELLDTAGNGNQSDRESFRTLAENIVDLRARSQFIREGRKVHLLTISLGSMIGFEWASQFPNEISGMVAINTSHSESWFFERLRPGNYLSLIKTALYRHDSAHRESEILMMTTNMLQEKDRWTKIFSQAPETQFSNFMRQLLAARNYRLPNQKPATDILLLCAQKDRLVSCECTKAIGKFWGLDVQVHPEAGHDLPLDDADWVCQQIQSWLSGSQIPFLES